MTRHDVEEGRADTVLHSGCAYGAVVALPLDDSGRVAALGKAIASCPFSVVTVGGSILVVYADDISPIQTVIERRDRLSREISRLGTASVYVLSSDELMPAIPLSDCFSDEVSGEQSPEANS